MAHTSSCANARNHECVCRGCGGSLHGWPFRVELARDDSGERRHEFRADADLRWGKTGSRRRKPSFPRKAAGSDTAVADIVDWLADHQDIIDDVEKLGIALANQVIAEVDKALETRDRRGAMVDHFWCDLLAALASAISEVKELSDRVIRKVVSAIFEERKSSGRSFVERIALRIAVKKTSEAIRTLLPPLPVDVRSTLLTVRILAIFMCPGPERHPAVIKHCVRPLVDEVKPVISAETKARLVECFPSEWPPDGREA